MWRQKRRGLHTEPWGTPRFMLRYSDAEDRKNMLWAHPQRYDQHHDSATLEKLNLVDFMRIRDGDILFKALIKSTLIKWATSAAWGWQASFPCPDGWSSVGLSYAVWVLWFFLKPVWKGVQGVCCGLEVYDLIIICMSIFPEPWKGNIANLLAENSVDDEGTGIFFSAIIQALFQAGGKIPLASEKLNNLVRKGAMTGNALATVLWGMSSSPWLGLWSATLLKWRLLPILGKSWILLMGLSLECPMTQSELQHRKWLYTWEVVMWFIWHKVMKSVTDFGNQP